MKYETEFAPGDTVFVVALVNRRRKEDCPAACVYVEEEDDEHDDTLQCEYRVRLADGRTYTCPRCRGRGWLAVETTSYEAVKVRIERVRITHDAYLQGAPGAPNVTYIATPRASENLIIVERVFLGNDPAVFTRQVAFPPEVTLADEELARAVAGRMNGGTWPREREVAV